MDALRTFPVVGKSPWHDAAESSQQKPFYNETQAQISQIMMLSPVPVVSSSGLNSLTVWWLTLFWQWLCCVLTSPFLPLWKIVLLTVLKTSKQLFGLFLPHNSPGSVWFQYNHHEYAEPFPSEPLRSACPLARCSNNITKHENPLG